ncbi:hypothetical protein EOPP23_19735 [Endozoicomonas sp. OPT23]|nr:hypothetical protein [Endozoicomonas sp. OPT23]
MLFHLKSKKKLLALLYIFSLTYTLPSSANNISDSIDHTENRPYASAEDWSEKHQCRSRNSVTINDYNISKSFTYSSPYLESGNSYKLIKSLHSYIFPTPTYSFLLDYLQSFMLKTIHNSFIMHSMKATCQKYHFPIATNTSITFIFYENELVSDFYFLLAGADLMIIDKRLPCSSIAIIDFAATVSELTLEFSNKTNNISVTKDSILNLLTDYSRAGEIDIDSLSYLLNTE